VAWQHHGQQDQVWPEKADLGQRGELRSVGGDLVVVLYQIQAGGSGEGLRWRRRPSFSDEWEASRIREVLGRLPE
jgi:hypothetical protein